MFGFLIKNEVNDDAVKLKTYTDIVLSKYVKLSKTDLCNSISNDFGEKNSYNDRNNVSFSFAELKEFNFSIDFISIDDSQKSLAVIGNGKYMGFMLQVSGEGNWSCSVSNGLAYRATGGAKKLVQTMVKKYDALDLSRYLKEFGSI